MGKETCTSMGSHHKTSWNPFNIRIFSFPLNTIWSSCVLWDVLYVRIGSFLFRFLIFLAILKIIFLLHFSKTEQHERELGRIYDEMDQLLLREKDQLQEKVFNINSFFITLICFLFIIIILLSSFHFTHFISHFWGAYARGMIILEIDLAFRP